MSRIFYKKQSDVESAKKFLCERITKNDSEILSVQPQGYDKGYAAQILPVGWVQFLRNDHV